MAIKWSRAEEETVLNEAVRILRHGDSLTKGLSIKDAIFQAQTLLDSKRRRDVIHPPGLRRYRGVVEKKIKNQLDNSVPAAWPLTMKAPAQQPPVQAPPPAAPTPAAPQPAAPTSELHEIVDRIVAGVRDLGRAIGAELAQSLSATLVEQLRSATPKSNGNGQHEARPAGTVEISEPVLKSVESSGNLPLKFVRPKVAVASLKGHQMQEMKDSFPHIDFRFISHDLKHQQATEVAANADVVIGLTKFMEHQMERALRDGCSKGNTEYVRIPGGISLLKQAVSQRFGFSPSDMERILAARPH